jgi:NTE family protein
MAPRLKTYLDGLAIWNAGKRTAGSRSRRKKVNLALQGGGAHGAFTWGVVDHLLADGRIEITGVSGVSAGAVNAVMLADGLARGGPQEARERLAQFWRAASSDANLPPLQRAATDRLLALLPFATTPLNLWLETMARYFSPYDFNPLNINPLRDLIERFVDFGAVRDGELALFIGATNVETGRLCIFPREKVSADVVMASAALPLLFRAVEVDGIPYWDGGYTGNPPLFPFLRATGTEDVIVVQINPARRAGTPRGSREIVNRLNEITFNATLSSELRAIDFVNQLVEDGRLKRGVGADEYRHLNVHRIDLGLFATRLTASSKLKTDFQFFDLLRRVGQRAARRFLDCHFDAIGVRSTIDLAAEAGVEWA